MHKHICMSCIPCLPTAHTFPPVPGQVTNLEVNDTSTVSVTVMWNPPMLHSGVITMYKVSVCVCVCACVCVCV